MQPTKQAAVNASKRKRRQFSDEFKEDAVRMVTRQGYKIGDAAKALGIDRHVLTSWIDKRAPGWHPAQEEPGDDPTVLRVQLREAMKEVKHLRAAVEVLKKATAYFANPNP